MKKTIIILCVLLIGSLALSAPAIGTIITQAQLDAQDLTTYDFDRIFVGKERTENALIATWQIKTLNKNEQSGDYVVVIKDIPVTYWSERYYICREQDNNKEVCLDSAKTAIIKMRDNSIEEERTRLIDWQTKTSYDNELNEIVLD